MKLLVRFATLTVGLLLLTGPVLAQPVPLDDEILGVVHGDHRPLPNPMFPMTENVSNLSGVSSDVTDDGLNSCLDAVPDTDFSSGEVAALSVIFDDTVEVDQFNQYVVTWAVRKQGNIIPLGTYDCGQPLFLNDPGETVSLCCSLGVPIPDSPLPIPVQFGVEWGARVVKNENGFTTQGILGSVTINAF